MNRPGATNLHFGKPSMREAGPDPRASPELYRNILLRRLLAFTIDWVLILAVSIGTLVVLSISNVVTVVLTLGALAVPLGLALFIVPFMYYTLTLAGRHAATPGMRIVGLELHTWSGHPPDFGVALLRTVLFHVTVVMLSPLVLVVALFNGRRRALHDWLSGTLVLNCPEPGVAMAGPGPTGDDPDRRPEAARKTHGKVPARRHRGP